MNKERFEQRLFRVLRRRAIPLHGFLLLRRRKWWKSPTSPLPIFVRCSVCRTRCCRRKIGFVPQPCSTVLWKARTTVMNDEKGVPIRPSKKENEPRTIGGLPNGEKI